MAAIITTDAALRPQEKKGRTIGKYLAPELRQKILDEVVDYLNALKPAIRYIEENDPIERAYEIGSAALGDGEHISLDRLDEVLRLSQTDQSAFLAACYLAAGYLRSNEPMPESLRLFAIEYLSGRSSIPPRPRVRPTGDRKKHDILVEVIAWTCRRFPVHATRSSNARPGADHKNSACDIVADAMKALEMTPANFDDLRKIWDRRGERTS